MKLFFETHSTSTHNERGVASGWLDPPLSSRGLLEADELGRRYVGHDFDAVYTSDLKRAVWTAAVAFGRRPVEDGRLREWNYGNWAGRSVAEVDAARASFIDTPFPAGESLHEVVERVAAFVRDLEPRPVLVIGHRATWYAFERVLRGRDLAEILSRRWSWQPGWSYDL